ncbi:hypothetical protein DTO271D3_6618 [Paecilomyces variotii]|nr:hypothetical protein DTO032I3_8644 [Paecilomyces variotii]KAJ9276722.1 hypothetical protein DTO021D3_6327 [Paecilomyces variotii]KAJ9313189.1 hypothetical protein DTO271D3_6618 [Paecilomyces variotii]KAJ9345774.1 hypothetical protein DTO027B6_1734 [Paecilomyces variotii]KAJ9387378.1 hypothetical protein DTO032I4_3242 [Paecilomyces variotii]
MILSTTAASPSYPGAALLTAALSRSFWDTIHPDSPIRLHRPQLARLAFFRLDRWHLLSLLIPQPESDRRLVGACPLNGALTHGHLALFSPLFPPLTHKYTPNDTSSTPLRRRLSPQDSSPSLDTVVRYLQIKISRRSYNTKTTKNFLDLSRVKITAAIVTASASLQ